MKRRNFLKISLSSVAAVSMTGCNLNSQEAQYSIREQDLRFRLPELFDTPPQAPQQSKAKEG